MQGYDRVRNRNTRLNGDERTMSRDYNAQSRRCDVVLTTRFARETNRLFRLRHDAIIGGDDQDDDVGAAGAT